MFDNHSDLVLMCLGGQGSIWRSSSNVFSGVLQEGPEEHPVDAVSENIGTKMHNGRSSIGPLRQGTMIVCTATSGRRNKTFLPDVT